MSEQSPFVPRRLAEKVSAEVVETALKLAMQRFGRELAITGSDEFRSQAVEAGVKLKLVFTNPELEAQRKALVAAGTPTTKADASTVYIAERNETCSKGMDILPHRRYDEAKTLLPSSNANNNVQLAVQQDFHLHINSFEQKLLHSPVFRLDIFQ